MRAPGLVKLIKRADRSVLKSAAEKFRHALNRGEPRHPVSRLAEFARNFGLRVAGVQTARDERGDLGCAQIVALDVLDHLRVSIRLAALLQKCRDFPKPATRRTP